MTRSNDFFHRARVCFGLAMAKYTKFVYRTTRFTNDPPNTTETLAQAGPAILTVWHGQYMLFPLMWPREKPIEVLFSRHPNAEFGAVAYKKLGVSVIRGSGSGSGKFQPSKGGAKVMRQMLRTLKQGASVMSTADVPVGPSRRAGRGIIKIAQHSGRPILPMAVTAKSRLVLKTWSRFAFYLPFSRGSMVLGQQIFVPKDADEAVLESKRILLEDSLNALTLKADHLAGRQTSYDTGGSAPKLPLTFHLYSLTTRIMSAFAPLWLERRATQGKEEPGRIGEKLGLASRQRQKNLLVWLHATSVGEATSCLGLIRQMLLSHDDLEILVTTTTTSAAQVVSKRLPEGSFHQFAPLDLPGAVTRFLDHWCPDLVVFAESEIWPNTIAEIHRRHIPMALVNGRLSKKSQKRWRKVYRLIRALLARFAWIAAQTHVDEQRWASLGVYNTVCYGNMKADIPAQPVSEESMQALEGSLGNRRVWLAASTHHGEEQAILNCHKVLKSEFPDLLTLIVPRHRERAGEISNFIRNQGLTLSARSKNEPIKDHTEIYLADTLGELALFYQLSPISFIGGSLSETGGHNPIEAITGNSVVLHGPNVDNFKDIYQVLNWRKGAIEIADGDDLANEVRLLLLYDKRVASISSNARVQAEALKGATEKTCRALLRLLKPPAHGDG